MRKPSIPDTAAKCNHCGAPVGQSCVTRTGHVRAETHALRQELVHVMRTVKPKKVRRAA